MTIETTPIKTTNGTEPHVAASPDDNQNSPVVSNRPSGQVLINIQHGGHIVEKPSAAVAELVKTREDLTLVENAVAGVTATQPGAPAALAEPEQVLFSTPFNYLLPILKDDLTAHLPAGDQTQIAAVVTGLKALGDAMVENSLGVGEEALQPIGNSTIPTIYTYWGQFIDHDLTANTDRDASDKLFTDITTPDLAPLSSSFILENLKNLRQPTVNLDSVYGDGPTFYPGQPTQAGRMYDGIKFRIGKLALNTVPPQPPKFIPGVPIPPDRLEGEKPNEVFVSVDRERDLPRIGPLLSEHIVKREDFPADLQAKPNFENLAFIADARNDENLIIAQLHLVFLRFHNAVVDWVQKNEPEYKESNEKTFARAQQLVRWHYQWLVVNDFLKTITLAGIVDKVLLSGAKHYQPVGEPFMPLEFSVAAYRFGHTMVRAAYDYNRNFGRPGNNVAPNASFDLLFTFTGNGFTRDQATGELKSNPFFGGSETLPFNWAIEWNRFVDKGSSIPDHFARKIDTILAPPLRNMVNQGNEQSDQEMQKILKRLARRNLLRGYLLNIPTGQSVAKAMDVKPLSSTELQSGNSGPLNQVLADNGFLERTPLWYYVLKEAEVKANGNSLGELGSRIVCETIIGQLLHDPESYLRQVNWNPSQGVKLPKGDLPNEDLIVTIGDLIKFAGLPV